ncbi:ADP-ribosylation factor GTPase-activating protein AGD5 isoform 2 [Hibiscus syriacus]|uniref:ADP-ribosylation factor GTPase-activating protein AGD5 isoform 2 n=1 Tax=Hibiscus syriacus TaxID=106335 RepID=A0A6A3AEN7_HIBSY|nr:ADP-ribosylation factor GTPase-activating protein AGD5 isoform 2 [Hibiscus syriacus]
MCNIRTGSRKPVHPFHFFMNRRSLPFVPHLIPLRSGINSPGLIHGLIISTILEGLELPLESNSYLFLTQKVRSATLDTWLPEQIAFIQSMGNEKANCPLITGKHLAETKILLQEELVTPVREPETVVVTPVEATTTTPTVMPPKFEYATDLFNMMSIDDAPSENASGSGAATTDDSDWACFRSAVDTSATNKNDPPRAGENNGQFATGVENLFSDSPPITTNQVPEKPQKDVKNDIMSLFEKSNTVQPYAMHQQQQLALLAHQQSLLMAAAAKSAPGNTQHSPSNGAIIPAQQQLALLAQQNSLHMAVASAPGNTQHTRAPPGNTQQPPSTSTSIPTQNWPNIGYQMPGSVGAQADLQKLMQNAYGTDTSGKQNVASSSFYALGKVTTATGAATNGSSKPQSASPVSSTNSPQTGKDYDFSSLTQGLFTKR